MQPKLSLYTLLLMLLGFGLTACTVTDEIAAEDLSNRPVNVVATTGMITDIAAIVGGDRVQVTGLMGPGVDPHLYKATESNVAALQNADIIFYNGLHLEAQMTGIFERMNDLGIRTAAVTDNIDRDRLLAPPEFEGNYDPHVWFDVTMWMRAVELVRDTYQEMDPTHAATYEENAAALLADLEALHAYVQEQAGRVADEQRVLVTAHDAFNYFGQAYGFEVRGLQGISTESEAGTADVQMLTDFIVQRQIPAIFVESSVPQRNIEAVQAAAEAQGFNVIIGGELFSDAMGTPGTSEGTYMGMVRHNVDTIISALLGE
jgi:manganese/zinc/iron transport system substrate-binding protein